VVHARGADSLNRRRPDARNVARDAAVESPRSREDTHFNVYARHAIVGVATWADVADEDLRFLIVCLISRTRNVRRVTSDS